MNTEHTNQPRQAANAAFEQWWQRHGLEDPMDDEDRSYITASSWARRGYLAAMQAQQAEAILCASCARANVDCPIYPQQTASCVEYRPAAQQLGEPVAWVRFCSDGGYEGPIMNSDSRMDGVRRTSGAWTPLYAAQPPAVAVPDAARLLAAIFYAEGMLTNLQPHIPQACQPQRMAFIDNYVDPVLERLRAEIAAAPQVAAPCASQAADSEPQTGLCRNDETHDEPGPIIRQFGYQPLFNAISSATKWRDGRTIEISVLDFQEALLAAAQEGGA